MSIHWLLYRSAALGEPWPAAVLDIARSSERRNPADGITGMLLFSHEQYLHYAESGRAEIDALRDRLARDGRHAIVWELRGTAPERRFAGLPMGYFDADREPSAIRGSALWRARQDWSEDQADDLIALMQQLAGAKYPTTLGRPDVGREPPAEGR